MAEKHFENPEGISPSESETKPPHVVVEIGSGGAPALFINHDRLQKFVNNPNEKYIHIDMNQDFLAQGRKNLQHVLNAEDAESEAKERVHFIEATGNRIPLETSSTNEVILSNVFGEARKSEANIKLFLDEVLRILKDHGLLTIIESYTPDVAVLALDIIKKQYSGKFILTKRNSIYKKDQLIGIDPDTKQQVAKISMDDAFIAEFSAEK